MFVKQKFSELKNKELYEFPNKTKRLIKNINFKELSEFNKRKHLMSCLNKKERLSQLKSQPNIDFFKVKTRTPSQAKKQPLTAGSVDLLSA